MKAKAPTEDLTVKMQPNDITCTTNPQCGVGKDRHSTTLFEPRFNNFLWSGGHILNFAWSDVYHGNISRHLVHQITFFSVEQQILRQPCLIRNCRFKRILSLPWKLIPIESIAESC